MYACAGARAAGWLDGRTFHAVLDLLFWRIAVYFIFIPLMVGGSEDAQRRCLHCQTAAHLYMYVVMTLMRLALVSFSFFYPRFFGCQGGLDRHGRRDANGR